MSYEFSVDVCATSANLGACFDFAGIPVNGFYNTVLASYSGDKTTSITIEGYGMGSLPTNEQNLVYKAFKRVFEAKELDCPAMHIHCINRIPPNSGMGSSAAAALGGIFLANEVLGNTLTKEFMLDIACEFEGHPDNAAPVIYNGAVITAVLDGKRIVKQIKLKKDLFLAIAVPDIKMPTALSRSVLPDSYSRSELVKAMYCSTFIIDCMKDGDYELMAKMMMEDVVHIPYRKALITGYDDVVSAAMGQGAYGCMISGAGSTMVSFCCDEKTAQNVSDAMVKAFEANNVSAIGITSVVKA